MELNIKKPEFKNINFNGPEEVRQNCFISKSLNNCYFTFLKQICPKGLHKVSKRSGNYLDIHLTNNEYLKFCYELDNYIIKYVSNKSDDWFGIKMNENKISDFYISSLLESDNDGFYIRAKLPMRGNKSSILIKDSKDNRLDVHRFPEENLLISCTFLIKGLKFLKDELISEYEVCELILHNPTPKLNLTDILSDRIGQSATNSYINSEDEDDVYDGDNDKEQTDKQQSIEDNNHEQTETQQNLEDNTDKKKDMEQNLEDNKDRQNHTEQNLEDNKDNESDIKQNLEDTDKKSQNNNETGLLNDNNDEDDHDKYELNVNMPLSKETRDDISQIIREKQQLLNKKRADNQNEFQTAEDLSLKIDELKQNAVKSAREIRDLENELNSYGK